MPLCSKSQFCELPLLINARAIAFGSAFGTNASASPAYPTKRDKAVSILIKTAVSVAAVLDCPTDNEDLTRESGRGVAPFECKACEDISRFSYSSRDSHRLFR